MPCQIAVLVLACTARYLSVVTNRIKSRIKITFYLHKQNYIFHHRETLSYNINELNYLNETKLPTKSLLIEIITEIESLLNLKVLLHLLITKLWRYTSTVPKPGTNFKLNTIFIAINLINFEFGISIIIITNSDIYYLLFKKNTNIKKKKIKCAYATKHARSYCGLQTNILFN